MTKSVNKVVVLKTTAVNQSTEVRFTQAFEQAFKATKLLFNEVPSWGLDEVYTKDSVTTDSEGNITFIPKDLKTARKALYEYTNKTVTYDQFEKMLKVMYLALTSASQSRGMVSAIIGASQNDEKLIPSDFDTIDEFISNWNLKTANESGLIYKIANTLKDIGFRNRVPYTFDLSPGERYSVVSNVHRMLTSWIECDKERAKTYKDEEEEIQKAYSEIDVSNITPIKQFNDYCINNNVIKHFDPRVHAYLRDCIVPALKGNIVPTEHFFLDKDGNKIAYNLSEGFFKILKDNPSLWNTATPLILEKIHILEKIMNHTHHHPNAFYPFIGDNDIHRFQYNFGDNYTKYDFETKGEDLEDIKVSIVTGKETVDTEFVKGCKVNDVFLNFSRSKEDNDTISFRIHTKDKYHSGSFNPNNYFNDLSIWKIKNGKCTNLLQFPRKGITVQATVKEPSIVKIDGYYAIRVNMTVVTKNDTTNNENLKWYLSTALPSAKSDRSAMQDTPANIERLKSITGKAFKFLGVDLGQRTPFSWAVGESTINGPVNTVNILTTGEYAVTNNDEYWNLLNDFKSFSKIIGITKTLSKGASADFNNVFIKKTIQNVIQYMASHNHGNDEKFETIKKFINDTNHLNTLKEQLLKCNNDLSILKKDYNFIGTIVLKYLSLRFNSLKNDRKYHLKHNDVSTKLNQEFKWLKIIESMKRALRSVSYLGTDNTRTPINLDKITDYFNGCKDNFLKVIASSIVEVAIKNNCNVIVMEGLNKNGTRTSLNKRNENFLHSLWSPARVTGAIENAANWHGITVAEVSESQTSQVHFETQTYGYRDKTKLYYLDNGEVKDTHADINAAKNIILKFVTRHASTTQVSINSVSEKDDEGKRMKGFLTHKFGTIKTAQDYFKKDFSGVDFVYLNGNKWISKEDKIVLQNSIKEKVLNK